MARFLAADHSPRVADGHETTRRPSSATWPVVGAVIACGQQ